MNLISFMYEGTEYSNFDIGDESIYNELCSKIGKESLDKIIVDIDIKKNQPSNIDTLGQTVADLTLSNMQLNSTVDTLGAMAAQSQLDIMGLKGGAS